MFWIAISAFSAALALIQLGWLAAWVVVLALAFKVALILAGLMGAYLGGTYFWRRHKQTDRPRIIDVEP